MTTPLALVLRGAWRSLAGVLLATALAVGCGGGGGSAGVDTGGTGAPVSFSAGRIVGFGSIIVNGIRFDDSTARIVDDDGVVRVRGDLKLGMQTEVQAGAVTVDASTGVASSTATAIQFGSQMKGPVQAVDVSTATLTVLGQRVKADAATVFDGLPAGLNGVQVGSLVEVYAFLDASTATYAATRIELKASVADYKVVGAVAALNASAKTLTIGGATISYAGIPGGGLPVLSNGLVVRAHLQTARQGTTWVATSLAVDAPAVADGAETEVEGYVTDFSSVSSFKVGGVTVNASGPAVVFRSGNAAQLANGVRVEVEGVTRAGVLAAGRVDVKTSGGGDQTFELHGAIETVNASAQSFVLRGVTVTWNSATRFDDGAAANLAAGTTVEVRGTLSSNGNQVVATRIKFER